jgi:hypothetical protein
VIGDDQSATIDSLFSGADLYAQQGVFMRRAQFSLGQERLD